MNAAAKSGKILSSVLTNVKLASPTSSEPLIYPYSITAKLIQFPWVHAVKKSWMLRYFLYGNIVCYPLWLWIDTKVNSPEAKIAWETKKRLDFEKEHKKEWEI